MGRELQDPAPEPGRRAPSASTMSGEQLPQATAPGALPGDYIVAGPEPLPNDGMGGSLPSGPIIPPVYDPTQGLQQPAPTNVQSSFEVTAPPAEPQLAVDNAALNARVGELTQALGQMRAEHNRQMQEMQLQQQAAVAATRPGQPAQPLAAQLPPGVNPTDNVTVQDLHGVLQNLQPTMEAQIVRSTWDVTPVEEQAAMQAYPYLANTPEPDRTKLIRDAAHLLRPAQQAATPSNAPTPGQAPAATPASRATRPAARTVPYVEHAQPSQAADLRPTDANGNIAARYEQAKRIADPKQRLEAMKRVMMEAQQAAGLGPDQLVQGGFTMKS